MASVSQGALDQHDREVIVQYHGLILYNDGLYDRASTIEAPANPLFVNGVSSKDIVIDPSAGVWARIFLPQLVAAKSVRVPLVLHFHGGGFCVFSPASPFFHDFCSRMAVASRCLWMSVNYRLAPENPLPTAYDDAYATLVWLLSQASAQGEASGNESWLAQHVDFSECFLAGESVGGTIVHFLAARAAGRDWSPVRIRGLLMIHPSFVTKKRDRPATTDKNGQLAEFFVRSALPPGAEGGHPWMNPLHPESPKLSKIDLPPAFVAVAEKDAMHEVNVEYYEALKKAGKKAQLFESIGEGHCFHLKQQRRGSAAAEQLEAQVIEFIHQLSSLSVA